jgi:hypothetical protein
MNRRDCPATAPACCYCERDPGDSPVPTMDGRVTCAECAETPRVPPPTEAAHYAFPSVAVRADGEIADRRFVREPRRFGGDPLRYGIAPELREVRRS